MNMTEASDTSLAQTPLKDLQLILIVCNPIKRAISEYHHAISGEIKSALSKTLVKNFKSDYNKFFKNILPKINRCRKSNLACPSKLNFNETVKLVSFSNEENFKNGIKIDPAWAVVVNGLYSLFLENVWLKSSISKNDDQIFKINKNFHIINGDKILNDLPEIILKYEKILNLPNYKQGGSDQKSDRIKNRIGSKIGSDHKSDRIINRIGSRIGSDQKSDRSKNRT